MFSIVLHNWAGVLFSFQASALMPNELLRKQVKIMAFTKEKERKYDYTLNDVQNVRQWKDGGITFTAIVNGIYIYNMRIVETKEDWFISFPSRKGSDDKYYKHVYFPIDQEMKDLIEAAINKALEK